MSLHYFVKLEILLAHVELLDREAPEFIQPQLWLQSSPDLNPVDNSVWKILQERCTKHATLICSYQRRHWWMAATMTTWFSLGHFILSRSFSSSRSVMRIFTYFLAVFPHTVINWIQIWRIWRTQLTWDKFWSSFLWQRSGSTCVMRISSFTRLFRDIIQMRWKTFTHVCRKFIQDTVYHISSESPEFCRRHYKKTFWSLFLDTL